MQADTYIRSVIYLWAELLSDIEITVMVVISDGNTLEDTLFKIM